MTHLPHLPKINSSPKVCLSLHSIDLHFLSHLSCNEVIDVVRKDNSLLRAELTGLRQELQDIKQLLRSAPGVPVSDGAPAQSTVVVPKEAPAGDDTGEIHVDG